MDLAGQRGGEALSTRRVLQDRELKVSPRHAASQSLLPSGEITEVLKRDAGFPSSSEVKNPPAVLETQVQSLVRKGPLEKGMATLRYSCLENSMDRGAWLAIVHGVAKESDMI